MPLVTYMAIHKNGYILKSESPTNSEAFAYISKAKNALAYLLTTIRFVMVWLAVVTFSK